MLFRKRLLLSFLILYEITNYATSQEYLKDAKPKEFKFDINELPPVELPQPMFSSRTGRAPYFAATEDVEEYDARQMVSHRPTLMDIVLETSAKEGLNAMWELYSVIEPDMIKNGHILQENHPAALLSKFSAPVEESNRREMAAFATLTAAKAFRKNYHLNGDLARQAHSQKVSLRRTALESLCPPRDAPTCMPASDRYRTHDGTCNNKRRQRWGAAQMPFGRFLPPEYGDGVDSVRKSVDEGTLSSSRFVSLLVHGARDGEAPLTLMLAQWGQLLDHDLTSTAQPRSINGSVPSCCGNKDFHPSCFPIKVPIDDPWLSPLKVRCLEFLRSAPAQRRDCVLSWREQTNQATAYIDASPIYSNSVKTSDNARVFRNGLLIFGRGNPTDDVCQRGAIATNCIRSGDGRSGEQPGLLALHHVWVGEHNHIAMRLSEMNLHWSDEKIYQETRRIIGAMFQHITYREFLPIILGREVAKLFELDLMNSGYYEGYDAKANPTVANSFAAAAFRFGHSLVQNSYMRCDRFHNVLNNNVSLHEEFQRGDIGSVGSLHRLIRGMANQKTLKRDEFITPELTNHLFQTPGFPFGLDLAAINIQRGRDHGIPPYTNWRVPCGLSPINTWEEFANVVGPESARRISHAYHNVHDIDLFVGGIAERPVMGGLVGPTFACIIAQQFSNARKGDRFWYENGGFESSFTPAQLHAMRRVTLASVLCRSVGGGTFQPLIFLPADFPNNKRLPCGVGSLAEFDLEPWLEQDPFASIRPEPLQLETPAPIPSKIQTPAPTPPLPVFIPPPPTAPPPTETFEPPVLDRIFEIVQSELETNAPIPDNFITDNKVGFLNRRPPATKGPIFIAQSPVSSGSHRVKNSTNVSDKLDLKRKGTTGHITKQKPIPGVNNKLDKNSRKGPHRNGFAQTTTRRTIVVNNIPIELRDAGANRGKETTTAAIDAKIESRTEDLTLTSDISEKDNDGTFDNLLDTENRLKSRSGNIKISESKPQTDPTNLSNHNETIRNETLLNTENNDVQIKTGNPNKPTDTISFKLFENGESSVKAKEDNHKNSEQTSPTKDELTSETQKTINNLKSQDTEVNTKQDFIRTGIQNDSMTKIGTKQAVIFKQNTPNDDDTPKQSSKTENIESKVVQKDETDITAQDFRIDSNIRKITKRMSVTTKTLTEKPEDTPNETETQIIGDHHRDIELKITPTIDPAKLPNNSHENHFMGINGKQDEMRHETTELSTNIFTENSNNIAKTLSTNDSDIDPMSNSPSVDHRRVQRRLISPTILEELKDKLKLTTLKTFKSNYTEHKHNKTWPTKHPKEKETTVNTVQVRQYHNRPTFSKPPKVIVDSGNGDSQYQIEINIRQTNKSPNPSQSTPDYITNYDTRIYDRFTSNYAPFPSTTPLYAHFPPSPTQISQVSTNNKRTKPPTIIFLNEHDEHSSTTRQPGFVHSIVGWNSGNRRPLPQETDLNVRPGYEAVLSRPQNSVNLPSNYQSSRPGDASSFSQAQLGGVQAHASSQAVSNGQYGSIAGFASANGADSTFSFNIRPKPDNTQINRPHGFESYGLAQAPPQTWYVNNPGFGEHNPSYDVPNRENLPSPFSSANSQTYYIRKRKRPQQREDLAVYRESELIDYDYISRTRQDFANITALEDTELVDVEYDDDDDDEELEKSPLLRKFNKDGYLRPELMIETLLKTLNETDTTTSNSEPRAQTTAAHTWDDNYVLPAMNSTKDIPKDDADRNMSTNFPDTQGKQLNNDIFAEDLQENDNDDDELTDDDSEQKVFELQHKRINMLKRNQEKIAFAPIVVLTKPERPDNWVIYDSPKEAPSLPQIPELNTDISPSAEIPKPIRENIWLSLANIKRRIALRRPERPEMKSQITSTNSDNTDSTLKNREIKNAITKLGNVHITDDITESVRQVIESITNE